MAPDREGRLSDGRREPCGASANLTRDQNPRALDHRPLVDPDTYNRLLDHDGFVAAYRYWEPALAFALERTVEDHPQALLDLGAGHTCFLDASLQSRASLALRPYRNVILVLPERDPRSSVEIIRSRCRHDSERDAMTWKFDDVDFIRFWVESDQNPRLAKHILYTGADGPEAVADRVLALLS